jgi:hypothetical protein
MARRSVGTKSSRGTFAITAMTRWSPTSLVRNWLSTMAARIEE